MERPASWLPARRPRRNASFFEAALVDAAVDSYVDWREESAAVRRAYRDWAAAERIERPGAFAGYIAALDREARASTRYAHVLAYFQATTHGGRR
jgi:hypothetical protein